MKRDFDLIRKILLAVEDKPSPEPIQLPELLEKIPGSDPQAVGYHIDLMSNAGLIEGKTIGYPVQGACIVGLTWAGHDFLDNARSDTVWNKVMGKLAAIGGSVSMETFKLLLDQAAKSALGLS